MSYRLLTEEEIAATRYYNPTTNSCYQVNERAVAKAQDKKTVAIRDKEWREKIENLQGEWASVAETYCPDWVLDLRHILSEMERKQ